MEGKSQEGKGQVVKTLEPEPDMPIDSGQAVVPMELTPLAMLAVAVEQGQDLVRIEKLMDMERQWKADIAREAYYSALAAFKSKPLTIYKDRDNEQYNSKYSSIGNIVGTTNEAMGPHGLNASWDIDQSADDITVTCILAHTLGHTKQVSMTAPPDVAGKKNKLQEIKSTITYLRKETFEAVTGVVTSYDGSDDDGNRSGPQSGPEIETISEQQVADLEAMIDEVGADKEAFLKVCGVQSFDQIETQFFGGAIQRLEQKRKQQ